MYDEEYEDYQDFKEDAENGGYDGFELINSDDVPGWGGLEIILREPSTGEVTKIFIRANIPDVDWVKDCGRHLVNDVITEGTEEDDLVSKAINIRINIDNAAFNDPDGKPDPYYQNLELSRILERLAKDVRGMGGLSGNVGDYINLHDANGNYVGVCEVVEDEQ